MLKRRSGLGSLIPGGELAAEGGALAVPITQIAVNPYQPRRIFAPEALEELAESIRQHGILQPLTVRTRAGGFELIAGERRLQAARKAGLAEVPVHVRECSDKELLELALVENLQREDLNPVEAAQSYQQLAQEFGLSQTEIATRVGKSRSAIANTMRLLALPPPVLQAVEEGRLTEGHARTLLAEADPARQRLLFARTLADELSVRALEALVAPTPKATPRTKAKATPERPDANLRQCVEALQAALGTRVRLTAGSTPDKGRLEIDYYTLDDLNRLYDLLTGAAAGVRLE
jgi:ParB family chromosome partitioning protein